MPYNKGQDHTDTRYFKPEKEEPMEEEIDYPILEVGDVVLITEGGHGFIDEDINKYVEIVEVANYGYKVAKYQQTLDTFIDGDYWVNDESFGKNPLVLFNTLEENKTTYTEIDISHKSYSTSHYDLYYTLTEQDIQEGKIKVDAYWVAKQWKTGSRDDSGALWHSLKTIARFGEKNSVEREIKALYNQAKALARVYGVELE